MTRPRRQFLRLAGFGVLPSIAGCLETEDAGNGNGADETIVNVETRSLGTRAERPAWAVDDKVGHVVLVDSTERERAVFGRYEADRMSDEPEGLLADIDYETERVLVVESKGPDACHDRLELSDIRLEVGDLRATAAVIDTSDDETVCAEVVTFPFGAARISFEADATPSDSATVEVTDGWGETATISALVDDPLGPELDSLDGSIRPDTTAEPIPPLECDRSGVERHPQLFDESEVVWGNVARDGDVLLGLRIDETAYDYGETARIALTNVTDEPVYTGNRNKYNLQLYTEAGWQDVGVVDDESFIGYTDIAIEHVPGEGFEWAIELTEADIASAAVHDHAQVCPELQAGRYRFVFWGAPESAVAVGFDLRTKN